MIASCLLAALASATSAPTHISAPFVPNAGQWDPQVLFLAQRGALNLWVTRTGLVYEQMSAPLRTPGARGLLEPGHPRVHSYEELRQAAARDLPASEVFRVDFVGATGRGAPVGVEATGAKTNFFVGRSDWHTGLPNYRAAMVKDVYPGVDLVVSFGDAGRPRYDFVLQSGVPASRIRIRLNGARDLRFSPDGSLRYRTSLGPVLEAAPTAFRIDRAADGRRLALEKPVGRAMAVRRVRRPDGCVGFAVPGRDRSDPVLIDPEVAWGKAIGGSGGDTSFGHNATSSGLAIAPDGSIVVVGGTEAAKLPGNSGTHSAHWNMFATKISATGAVQWTTYVGGPLADNWANCVAIDKAGEIVMGGEGGEGDMPQSDDDYDGAGDGALVWLDANGNVDETQYVGGWFYDEIVSIAISPNGNSSTNIAVGEISDSWAGPMPTIGNAFTFDGALIGTVSRGTHQIVFNGSIFKVANALLYWLSAQKEDAANNVAGLVTPDRVRWVSSNTIMVWGVTTTGQLPNGKNQYGGGFPATDGFVCPVVLNGLFGGPIWSRYIGGPGDDYILDGDVDASGNIFAAGFSYSGTIPGAMNANSGQDDYIAAEIAPDWSTTQWIRFVGGPQNDWGIAMNLAADGSLLLWGGAGTNFPGAQNSCAGNSDALLTDLSKDGTTVNWSRYVGGTASDWGLAIALDSDGSIIAGGQTYSSKLGNFTGSTNGHEFSFVTKVVGTPELSFAPSSISNGQPTEGTVQLDWNVPAGTQVVNLSSNSSLVTVPASVKIAGGKSAASFSIKAVRVAADSKVKVTANESGVSTSATLTLKGPRPSSFEESVSPVTGGSSVDFTVTLDSPAPDAGLTLALSSTGLAGQTLPATVAVRPGYSTTSFTLHTIPVTATETGRITVAANGVSKSITLTILPPVLTSFSLSAASIKGGSSCTGTVKLSGGAPSSGIAVKLSSSSPDAILPATVPFPAGAASITFKFSTAKVASNQSVKITASYLAVAKSATIELTK